MLPTFLFPEQAVTGEGEGPSVEVEDAVGQVIQLTLGITDAIEQESLEVAVYGSAGGVEWGAKPMTSYSQKFYEGMYTILLDLGPTPDIRFLKVKYKTNRWGHWTSAPRFKFFLFAEAMPGNSG